MLLKKLPKNDAKGWSPKRRYVSKEKHPSPKHGNNQIRDLNFNDFFVDTTNGDIKIPNKMGPPVDGHEWCLNFDTKTVRIFGDRDPICQSWPAG